MILTEKKPFSELLNYLKDITKIFLVGCGECAATCKSGGKEEILQIKTMLEENGKTVTGFCIPDAPCLASQIKKEFAACIQQLRQAEGILVLACGLGVQSVKENQRLDKEVFPGLNSICTAALDAQGTFYEKCSLCGECVLALTGGLCPITLCPKSLLNGPCGGMNKGKCELDNERDCVWVLIYKELEKRKRDSFLQQIMPPRDFEKSLKPRRVKNSF